MPCRPQKARKLLEAGKAKVVQRTPFTLQLLYGSSGYRQPIILGVDSGFTYIGLSAVTDNEEVFSSEVKLRTDIVDLNSERRMYRRNRRNRKTRYRKARFLNRRKPDGWLVPSMQHKLDGHLKVISNVQKILPITKVAVEVAAFDIQKIKNPDISGVEYQNGEQSGFWNVREYVLYRDNHKCTACKGKSKDQILNVHHLVSRKVGGDRPDNLVTLCETCHKKYHDGLIDLKVKPSNGFKAETFMSMVRWRIVNQLREQIPTVHTYGYRTKSKRISLGIEKSHINDAFVIADSSNQKRSAEYYQQRQVRKQNRKLFKGARSHLRNTAPRFVHGFQRYDKVRYGDSECFIFGRRTTGYFDIRDIDGNKLSASVNCKKLALLESTKSIIIDRRYAVSSPA